MRYNVFSEDGSPFCLAFEPRPTDKIERGAEIEVPPVGKVAIRSVEPNPNPDLQVGVMVVGQTLKQRSELDTLEKLVRDEQRRRG